jgi:membrane-associated protease RseP (regulator of RpoE activity)
MTQKNASFPQLAALLLLLPLAVPARAAWESTPAPASAPTPVARPAAVAAMSPRSPLPSPAPPRAPRAPRFTGGYLGVELVDLTPDLREHFGAPRDVGVMVGRVEPGSPAARAGLEVGDVVTAIGDEPVHDSWGLSGEISSREGNEVMEMTLFRAGKKRHVEATLERREREAVDVGRWIFPPTPSIPPVPPVAAAPGAPPLPPMPPVGPALERLGRLLESDDFQDQIRAYQLRVDAEVEKRMRELELRLKELERRLQDGDRRR